MNYTIGKDSFGTFDWGCYMEGYKEAVKILFETLPKDQRKINRNIILPSLFLVRHFLELSFKEILSHEDFINTTGNLEPIHNLKTLWIKAEPKIKIIIEKNTESKKNKNLYPYSPKLKTIKKLVDFFDKYDPESYCFRYPQNPKFKSTLPNKLEINLEEIKSDYKIAQTFLSNIMIFYVLNDKYYK